MFFNGPFLVVAAGAFPLNQLGAAIFATTIDIEIHARVSRDKREAIVRVVHNVPLLIGTTVLLPLNDIGTTIFGGTFHVKEFPRTFHLQGNVMTNVSGNAADFVVGTDDPFLVVTRAWGPLNKDSTVVLASTCYI